jgi:alpha-tubulin suppressor-like RCC1 family protein
VPSDNKEINDKDSLIHFKLKIIGIMPTSESNPVLFGFGKNYYHNFGPAQQSQLNHTQQNEDDENYSSSISAMPPLTHLPSYQFIHEKECDDGEEKQSPPTPWDQEDDPLIDVKCTIASTHFLTRSGKIYICGTIHGQVRPSLTQITIPLPLKCVQLATGRHFCIARMEGGLAVCAWGAGHFGQLGLGGGYVDNYADGNRNTASSPSSSPPSFVHRPTVIEALLPHRVGAPISSVAAGYWHSMALTEEGTVYAWGCNRNAQCGKKPNSKDPPTICQPERVSFHDTGSSMGNKKIKINKIVAGRSHSVALDEGGQCYTWGANQYGQCGILSRRRLGGVTSPKHVDALAKVRIADISAGDVHTLALTGGGRVFGWGGGFEGQLGTGYVYQMNPKPKLVSELDFVAIEAGQEHKAKQKEKQTPQVNGAPLRTLNLDTTPRIVSVTAKGNSSFAISSTGHVYAWGCNDVGNLGLPKPDPSALTYSDPGQIGTKLSIQRQFQTYSFDSSHNIALPQRLDSLKGFHISTVGASSTFMWCLGTKRQDLRGPIGRTLYEVHEAKLQKSPRGQHEINTATSLSPGGSNSKRENGLQHEEQTITSSEISSSSEVGGDGWTRAKKEPALPKTDTSTSLSKEFSRSLDSSTSFGKEQEEPSQAFSTTPASGKKSSASTPGKKKRLFSPKKLVQAFVRRASGSTGFYKTEQASLPTIDIVGSNKDSPKNK